MQAFRRMLVGVIVCLASLAIAQNEDSAARVFGPRWRQMCRDSGMIFSGTVLEVRSGRLESQDKSRSSKCGFVWTIQLLECNHAARS